MATKKSSASKKAAVKTSPKKTTHKTTVKTTNAAPRRTRKDSKRLPGGYIMYVFLIIAALAAIVAIAGAILESNVELTEASAENYDQIFTFIAQCKSAALGIFGVFLVLACCMKLNTKSTK